MFFISILKKINIIKISLTFNFIYVNIPKKVIILKGLIELLKSTGIVRHVDELGRITLPIELRRSLEISDKDSLEIFVASNTIVLRKSEASCIFCGDARNITKYEEKNICYACLEKLKNINTNNI